MKTELVDVNETRKNLVVEIPPDVVDKEIERVSVRYGRSARLPGFRPGKVPAKVIRQRFRSQILHDVAHELIEKAVGDALVSRGVEPVDVPDIRDVVLEEGRPLTFKAEFDVVPPFDPGDVGSIQARRPPAVVEDEAVAQALERLRDRAARYEPVEGGAAEAGHTLVVDLERTPTGADGAAGETSRHEKVPVEIGAAANPPGLDAELTGLEAGATKTFTLAFPADHAVAELAGTSATYTVTVHEIRRRVVPALDDEFAKDLGEFADLAALRDRVRQDLEAEAKEAAERQVRSDVLKQLAATVPFPVPASLVDREVDRRVEDFARRLLEQQIDPRRTNIDWSAFREGQREVAQEAVASAIVLDQIARRETLEATEADIDQELQRYAAQTGHQVAAVRAQIEKEGGLGRLGVGLRRDKALAWVMARATILDQ